MTVSEAVLAIADRELSQPATIDDFAARCEAALAEVDDRLIIHFTDLEFATSSFFASLVVLQQKAERAGIRFGLAGIAGNVRQAFTTSQLDRMFVIGDDPDQVRDLLA